MRAIVQALTYELLYWFIGILMIFTHSLRVVGRQRIPRTGPVLLVGNHQSFLDIVVNALACRRRVYFLARKTLARNRTLAFVMNFFDTTLIDQDGFSRAGLQQIADQLAKGRVVMVYPEGERTTHGGLNSLKPGISLLLKKVKATIVPIGISGAFESLPRWRNTPYFAPPMLTKRPQRIGVYVGEPILPSRYENLSRGDLLEFLFDRLKWCVENAQMLKGI